MDQPTSRCRRVSSPMTWAARACGRMPACGPPYRPVDVRTPRRGVPRWYRSCRGAIDPVPASISDHAVLQLGGQQRRVGVVELGQSGPFKPHLTGHLMCLQLVQAATGGISDPCQEGGCGVAAERGGRGWVGQLDERLELLNHAQDTLTPCLRGRYAVLGRTTGALPGASGVATHVLAFQLEHAGGVVGELLGAAMQEDPVARGVCLGPLLLELHVTQLAGWPSLDVAVTHRGFLPCRSCAGRFGSAWRGRCTHARRSPSIAPASRGLWAWAARGCLARGCSRARRGPPAPRPWHRRRTLCG